MKYADPGSKATGEEKEKDTVDVELLTPPLGVYAIALANSWEAASKSCTVQETLSSQALSVQTNRTCTVARESRTLPEVTN